MEYALIALFILVGYFIFFSPPRGWIIGPIINGINRSEGLPKKPFISGTGWYFDFPLKGHVHSVQNFGADPQIGIRVKFRIEGTAEFRKQSGEHGTVTIMIQKRGDRWSERFNRWYYKESIPLTEGTHIIHASFLKDTWTTEDGTINSDHLPEFFHTLKNIGNVSLFFGGVSATAPAKFVLESYEDV